MLQVDLLLACGWDYRPAQLDLCPYKAILQVDLLLESIL